MACGRTFQPKPQRERKRHALFRAYVWQRQSIGQLAQREGRSHVWIRKQLDAAKPTSATAVPQPVVIAADMTFWGRGYGVCVFRAPVLKMNLWWKEALNETPWVYEAGLRELRQKDWMISAAVIDGKRGVAQIFERVGIPVQYCQFHQVKTITKYLTRKPKTDAARELRALALRLKDEDKESFTTILAAWHERWKTFLDEKSEAPQTKRGWQYTHRRVRAAYRSLTTNLFRLFTYAQYPEFAIPKTTNTLDGMFSQIKNRLAVHRGLRRDRRYKLIDEILKNRN